jgi:hypothetical protein
LQTSLASLSGVTLKEMADLLQGRLDTLDRERIEVLVAASAVVLLALAAVLILWNGRQRRDDVTAPSGGDPGRGMSVRQTGQGPGYGSLIDAPPYGEVDPTRRERSGALR